MSNQELDRKDFYAECMRIRQQSKIIFPGSIHRRIVKSLDCLIHCFQQLEKENAELRKD